MKKVFKTMAFTLLGLVLSSNLWAASATYTQVTDASSLKAGDVIVLGCADKGKAAGAMGSNSYLASEDATFKNGVMTSSNAIEITLGGSAGAWTLTTSEGQITTSAAKALKKNDGTQKTWTISFKDGTATITGGSYGSIQYNNSSPRFVNYTSSQTAIEIYKKSTTPTPSCTSRTITFAGSPTTVEKTTADAPFKYAASIDVADGQTIGYSSSDTKVATVAADGTVTIVGTGTTKITASVPATDTYCEASAFYTVNVTKPVFSCWTGSLNCDFTKISGFSEWGSTYKQHVVEYTNLTVTFADACKQSGTITDCPVTKGSDVTFVAAEKKVITQIHVNCKQWSDKKQTITLNYSTDGGTNYNTLTPSVTSDDFEIESTNLPEGTNAVKLTFSSNSNQIGIASACVTIEDAATLNSINVKTPPTKVEYNANEIFNPAGLVINAVYSNGTKEIAYAGNESDFAFNPTLSTLLTSENTQVTITYKGEKSTTQDITVNLLPTTLTLAAAIQNIGAGEVVSDLTTWVASVTGGAPRTFEFTSGNDEVFLVDGTEGMAGDNAGQTTVTVKAVATNIYAEATQVVTVNVLAATDPKLEVDPTLVEFTDKVVGQSYTSEKIVLMGENLTANATIEISGTDAAMFTAVDGDGNAISSIEQTDGDILADIYVKYAPTAAGTHSATMTISSTTANVEVSLSGAAKASYTVQWSINGEIDDSKSETVIDGNKVTIVPSATSCDPTNIAFLGWTNTTIADAAEAPALLFTTTADAPAVTDNVTYHAVFAEIGGTGEMVDKLITSIQYDTWTYSGTTTNITPASDPSYRLFGENAYVETAEIDLSKITKISVYGGYYGGDSYGVTKIVGVVGTTTTTWKDPAALGGKSQTARHDFEVTPNPLSGTGKIRVISKSGTGQNNGTGTRMTKVEVYTQEKDITYSHYSTTCVPPLVAPTLTEGGEFCTGVTVTIGKGENPEGVTLMYSTDDGASWNTYTEALSITATTTIKAKAVMEPKESEPAEATYTILPHYSDLTDLKATASADEVKKACVSFSNLLVNATNVYTVYLTDGTNVYMINKSGHGFNRGQKLSTGEHAILPYKLYNGVLQFNDKTDITVSSSDNETPATTMAVNAITASNYGQLVKIENVIYVAEGAFFKDGSDNTIKLGNNIVSASSWVTDGAKYDITGIITTQTVEEVTFIFISPRAKDLDVVSKAEKLNAPSNLTYENLTGSSVTLKWGEVTGATKYDVEVYDGSTRVKNNQTTSLSYSPKDLTSGKTYTWRVRAVGDDLTTSTSDWTDGTATFTTPAPATLYWIVNGDIEHPFATTTAASEKVVMPTTDPTSACDENYEDFICWVNRPVEGVQTRAPYNYELVADTSKAKSADGDKYFYALFGKVASEETDVYTLVTEAPDSWAGDYLIAQSESKFANGYYSGTNGIGKEGNYVDLSESIVDNTIAGEIGNPYHVTFETCEGGYLMKSQSGYYNYRSANSNGLDSTANVNTADDYPITIALNDGGTVHMSLTNGAKFQYNNGGSGYFRFYSSTSSQSDCYLYKRTLTPKTYSAYITTCPTFYDITIDDQIVGGEVTAEPNATIDAGATIQLTATASAGYTAEGGTWTVTNESTAEPITVKNNQFTMPTSDVTVSYAFVALVDNFQDALHGTAAQTREGAQYELPTLDNTTEGTRKDAFFKFAGWVPAATEITTGEPATEKPTILDGKRNATGATYKALWANATETAFVTEECGTAIPTNLHVVNDALTANSAKLDWNNVSDATKYHVSVYKATELVVEEDVTSSEYVAIGLTAATEYTFTVKAYKDCWGYEADAVPFKTKDAAVPHLVTLVAENGQIEISPELTDGKLLEGTVATVTATANDGYYFVDWNFTNVTPTSVNENVATFAMPTKAITITANFAEYPKVTWKMEGAADVVTTAVLNEDKFEVGTVKEAPADWKYKTYFPEFAGWVTSDKCDAEGNVETAEFVSATTEVPATGLTVYGAVAKSSAPDCSTATKITSNENLDMSALYVIGAEYEEATLYYTGIDGTWGKMTNDVTQTVPMIINISGTANALALIQSDGKYIEPCASNSFAVSDEQKLVVMNENGDLTYNSTRLLTYNHNSGSGGIRWYASTSSNPKAYLYKVALAYENLTIDPQPDYGRTDLVVGNYGTVCVPYAVKVADRSGATFWNIETSNAPGSTNPTSVTIVEETGNLVAGKPYIFCATGTEMAMFFSGDKYEGTESVSANGLYGNLTDGTITINDQNDPDAGSELTRGYFFVLQQKLYECGWNCTVDPNRGWVQANKIEDKTTPSPAPRRVIGNPNGTPTGINNLNSDGFKNIEGAHKYFHNNNIVIVNEGRIYNAQGILIQ